MSLSPISHSLDISQLKQLDTGSLKLRKLSDKDMAALEKMREMVYAKPTNLHELKNHISQKTYAEVVVDGKIVATLYNGGMAQSSNAIGGRIQNLPSMGAGETATGPELAQKRAEEIARALGGTIRKASTAATQAQYLAASPFKVEYQVDYEAMERDRRAALGSVTTPQTQVDTQILGESGADQQKTGQSAADRFLEFTSLSWDEKMYALILESMGLTQEELDAMSIEDREEIEAKIREKIEEEIEKKTGIAGAAA
jgi:hypothetical protein